MTPADPRLARLLAAAALARDHSASRVAAAQAARAEAFARLAALDPPPLDSAEAELQRAAQRHALWAEAQRHGLKQDIARQEAELRAAQRIAARARVRCRVLEKRLAPPRGQVS